MDISNRPICLIGRGSIGARHLENLSALGCRNVVAYSETGDGEKDRAFEKRYGVKTFHRPHEIEDLAPIAFIIAVPTSRHLEFARWAALQNAHIFMEKPLSDSLDGLEGLREELLRRGLTFRVGNNLRFHPYLRKLKAMLEDGSFGMPYFARFMVGQYLPDWHPWEDYRTSYSARKALGGGVVLTLQHEVDYARWFFGRFSRLKSMVRKVSALEIDVEDLATVLLETEDGVLIEIHLDYLQRPPLRTLHIQGSKGSVYFSLGDADLRFYDFERQRSRGVLDLKSYPPNQMYVEEMAGFLEAIREGDASLNDFDESVDVLRTCLEIKREGA